jgi:heme-degrading monooxygenase HmoA
VRRQPGFVCKVLLRAEEDAGQVAMLLVWESSAEAVAWTRHPDHDAAGEPLRELANPSGGRVTAMPRGGWTVVEVVRGAS